MKNLLLCSALALIAVTSSAQAFATDASVQDCTVYNQEIDAYDALLSGKLISQNAGMQYEVQNWKAIAVKKRQYCLREIW